MAGNTRVEIGPLHELHVHRLGHAKSYTRGTSHSARPCIIIPYLYNTTLDVSSSPSLGTDSFTVLSAKTPQELT